MSERSGYAAGVPCWIETWQDDGPAAARFYAGLFGWETDEVADGMWMARLRGRDVAIVGQRPAEHAHLPAGWTTSVWADDVDAVAARATEAGGSVIIPPFPTLDGGRMVLLADPSGALIAAWRPGSHRGAELVNEPAAWSWTQLLTGDQDRARAFYGSVFGWETSAFGDVTMFSVPGFVGGEPEQPVPRDVVAGMAPGGDGPARWQIDFWVDDVDATAAAAAELGGRVVMAPYDTPIARQAVLADPAGATFTVSRITIGA